ncbi:hypothetical protein LINGRAHAP2_LOCUS16310 [Linum grandiflorum]
MKKGSTSSLLVSLLVAFLLVLGSNEVVMKVEGQPRCYRGHAKLHEDCDMDAKSKLSIGNRTIIAYDDNGNLLLYQLGPSVVTAPSPNPVVWFEGSYSIQLDFEGKGDFVTLYHKFSWMYSISPRKFDFGGAFTNLEDKKTRIILNNKGCRHWDATDLLDGSGFRITARFHLCLARFHLETDVVTGEGGLGGVNLDDLLGKEEAELEERRPAWENGGGGYVCVGTVTFIQIGRSAP